MWKVVHFVSCNWIVAFLLLIFCISHTFLMIGISGPYFLMFYVGGLILYNMLQNILKMNQRCSLVSSDPLNIYILFFYIFVINLNKWHIFIFNYVMFFYFYQKT